MTNQQPEALRSLYDITGNITDHNTVLINRGDLQALHAEIEALKAAGAGVPAGNDVDQLLRQVFAVCEATEEAPEVEPKNEHQRGFDKGRRFEAKSIRRAIGDWFQSEFCGRSFMGEPVAASPTPPDAGGDAARLRLDIDEGAIYSGDLRICVMDSENSNDDWRMKLRVMDGMVRAAMASQGKAG